MMYSVYCYDEFLDEETVVMTGSFEECEAYVAEDICPEELYIAEAE